MASFIVSEDQYVAFERDMNKKSNRLYKGRILRTCIVFIVVIAIFVSFGQYVGGAIVGAILVIWALPQTDACKRKEAAKSYDQARRVFEQSVLVNVDGDNLRVEKGGETAVLPVSGVTRVEDAGGLLYIGHESGFYYWFPKETLNEEERAWFEEAKRYGVSETIRDAGGNKAKENGADK